MASNKSFKILIVFITSSLLLCACAYQDGFLAFPKHRFVFLKHYNSKDTLIVKDYLVFGMRSRLPGEDPDKSFPWGCDGDSVFNVFKKYLIASNIPMRFETGGVNRVDDTTSIFSVFPRIFKPGVFGDGVIKRRHFKDVAALTKGYPGQLVLVPAVRVQHHIEYGTVGSRYSGLYFILNLAFSVFIFKDMELVYYKSLSHSNDFAGTYQVTEYNVCEVPIRENIIERIVKQAMIDYVKRMQ
jgi:hypothetical protein